MCLLLLAVLLAADPADPAKALEDRMVRAIAAAEPGVAAVVVSRRKYDPPPPADKPWQLGRFDPRPANNPFRPGRNPQRLPVAPDQRKLDLADPQAAADNAFGSGLILADGLVLVTYHQIQDATKIYVRTAAGGSYADVHAADERSDLAVLKLLDPPANLRPVRLAEVRTARGPDGEAPTVRRGQWLIALGHPLAAGSADGAPTASWGILGNLRRKLLAAAAPGENNRQRPLASYNTLLQTDARIVLGCSGGGLFDLDGTAVGLTTAAAGVAGAETAGGYAVPFTRAVRRVVDALRAGREVEYGFLGVAMTPPDREFDRPANGVLLSDVSFGLPAAAAGLRGGDVIVGVDGQPVTDTDDLFLHVGAALAGTRVTVRFDRDGETRQTTVELAKHDHDLKSVFSVKRPAAFGLRPEWASVKAQDRGRQVPGVLIKELDPDTPAADKLRPLGDVAGRWLVTAVDGRPTLTPLAFDAATAGKASVRLTLVDPADPTQPREVVLP